MLEEVWKQTRSFLEKEIPAHYFKPLIAPLQSGASSDPSRLVLRVPDPRILNHLRNKYSRPIQSRMQSILGRPISIEFQLSNRSSNGANAWLHPLYRFEQFYVGDSNRFALHALLESAKNPGENNPLVVYGPAGCGKTHLLHGFGHRLLEIQPTAKIGYFTAEEFKDQFLQALKKKGTLDFKKALKSFDVLLLDDLHLLPVSNKTSREEFVHVLGHYLDHSKQVIITSEVTVNALPFESRLISRLLSGLQLAIELPDRPLRRVISAELCQSLELDLSADLVESTADSLSGSVREIESAIGKLHMLKQQGITLNSQTIARHLVGYSGKKSHSMDRIVDLVAEKFGIQPADILGNSRKMEFSLPRHISMFIGLQHSGMNKSAIARFFKKKDHTTVIHAEKKLKSKVESDAQFRRLYQEIVDELCKTRL